MLGLSGSDRSAILSLPSVMSIFVASPPFIDNAPPASHPVRQSHASSMVSTSEPSQYSVLPILYSDELVAEGVDEARVRPFCERVRPDAVVVARVVVPVTVSTSLIAVVDAVMLLMWAVEVAVRFPKVPVPAVIVSKIAL